MTPQPPDAAAQQSDAPDPVALEGIAVALTQDAAAVVRDGRAAGVAVGSKSTATDLVTDVDRDTEAFIVDRLARLRPGDAVLGEEGGASGQVEPGRVRWVIDPIDGTVNFVLGIPQYGVSVAAELDGVVVAGAVCNPVTGETFHAHLGGGAYLGADELTGPRDVPLERAVIATGFAYDAAMRQRQARVVATLLPRVADVRRLGAASLDLCFVAAGRLDGYFEAGLNAWDYAAGALIASEAGCVLTGLRGAEAGPRFLAASRPAIAADLAALLEELAADSVADRPPE